MGETFETRDGTFLLAGVMPAAVEFPTGRVDAWVPTSLIPPAGIPRERHVRWLAVEGRLRECRKHGGGPNRTPSTELAVRSAMGASGGRIAGGLVLEMLLLVILGGPVGLAFGIWGAGALAAMAPTDLPRLREVGLDVRVLAVTCTALLAAGLLSAIPAVLQARRLDLASAFKSAGRTTGAKGGGRARNALLVAQAGLVTVLAIGGSLLLRSY